MATQVKSITLWRGAAGEEMATVKFQSPPGESHHASIRVPYAGSFDTTVEAARDHMEAPDPTPPAAEPDEPATFPAESSFVLPDDDGIYPKPAPPRAPNIFESVDGKWTPVVVEDDEGDEDEY